MLTISAILAFVLVLPAPGMAESATVMISGSVYQGSMPSYDADVSLYTWDGSAMGSTPVKTVKTDTSGRFVLGEQSVDLNKPFNYAVKAQSVQYSGYALVYVARPAGGKSAAAAPISIDVLSPSGTGKLSGMVQSGNSLPIGAAIAGASVMLYSKDISTGTYNEVIGITNPVTADDRGKFEFAGLPFGIYMLEATKDTMGDRVEYAIYQQESRVNIRLTDTGIPYKPSAMPTFKPTASPATPTASPEVTITAQPTKTPTTTTVPTNEPTSKPVLPGVKLPCCPSLLLPLLTVGIVTMGMSMRGKKK